MSRPLLITDCDEVLLHFSRHFAAWLDEKHDILLRPLGGHFENALRRKDDGVLVPDDRLWPLIDDFFATEMQQQTPTSHVREALTVIGQRADIVILTNLPDHLLDGRISQLAALGIAHRVVCNGHGPKGAGVRALVEEHGAAPVVFVDDLAWHHAAVAEVMPQVFRLHMVAEPNYAHEVPPAPAAHARIDDWAAALPWILDRFDGVPLLRDMAAAEG